MLVTFLHCGWVMAAGVHEAIPITVRTVDQDEIHGDLIQLTLEGGLVLRPETSDGTLSIPAPEIIRIRRPDAAPRIQPAECLLLAGGDRLYGHISGSGPDQIVFDTVLQKGVSIPLERVRAFFTQRANEPAWQQTIDRMMQSKKPTDHVILSNGDLLHGFLSEISPGSVVLELDNRRMEIALGHVVAVVLPAEPFDQPERARQAQLRFTDGSRLTVSDLRWTRTDLQITFFDGTFRDLPPEAVQEVEIRSSRWVYLSELAPAFYTHTPLLTLAWPLQIDHNAAGGPMSIDGTSYERGLGMHSRSVVRFNLDGQFSQFITICGVDESAGALADLSAAVLVDGQTGWEQAHLRPGRPGEWLHVDLAGARTLELQVDYGQNGDLQDRMNWADAVLVR